MRVAILQLAPKLGQLEANTAQADKLLEDLEPGTVDILVLPELALTGYNFSSLKAIQPYLEPTAAGHSACWAARTARRLQCSVVIGYPETTQDPSYIPRTVDTSSNGDAAPGGNVQNATRTFQDRKTTITHPRFKNYNASMTISPDGDVLSHYRKTHLYYTDATWALPNPTKFETVELEFGNAMELGIETVVPIQENNSHLKIEGREMRLGDTSSEESPLHKGNSKSGRNASHRSKALNKVTSAFAVCMDINPEAFTASWEEYELASFVIRSKSSLLLGNMAWSTNMPLSSLFSQADEPDWETFSHWLGRLRPLIDAKGERLVVLADRAGVEPGGTKVFDLESAGRGEIWEGWAEDNLVVHTEEDILAHRRRIGGLGAFDGENSMQGAETPDEMEKLPPSDGELVGTEARYAGTSVVMALGNGRIKVWAIMGRAREGLLVANTLEPPESVWVFRRGNEDENSD